MGPTDNPLNDFKLSKVLDATATGTTTVNADVDMLGFDSVMFLTTLGVPNAGNFLKVAEGAQSNLSDAADLAGSKVTPTGAVATAVAIVVNRAAKRYVRLIINRSGITSTIGEVYALRFNSKNPLPISNNLGAVGAPAAQFTLSLSDPVEGAA